VIHSFWHKARHEEVWILEHDPEKWVPVFGQDHAQKVKR